MQIIIIIRRGNVIVKNEFITLKGAIGICFPTYKYADMPKFLYFLILKWQKYDIQEHKNFQRTTYHTYVCNAPTLVIIVMPSLCCSNAQNFYMVHITKNNTHHVSNIALCIPFEFETHQDFAQSTKLFLHKTNHKLLLVSEFATQANLTSVALFKYESSHLKAIVGVEYHTFIFNKLQ